jgi:nitroimidazol reductase NimA-like FMN-containing flavoprotein (pyridoxamine 5'-phosphate oxidase superfamily)
MTSASAPNVGLEELDDHDCQRLLRSSHLGRIAMSVGGLPAVFPVHFAMVGRDPVFRTEAVTKHSAVSAGHVVCLEVDDVDTGSHSGWSVMVIGRAHAITDACEVAEASLLPLQSWVGSGDAFVRIRAGIVSGCWIRGPCPEAGPR